MRLHTASPSRSRRANTARVAASRAADSLEDTSGTSNNPLIYAATPGWVLTFRYIYAICNAAVQISRFYYGRIGHMYGFEAIRRDEQLQGLAPSVDPNSRLGNRAMSRTNEIYQALRRQSPHSRWLLELDAPSVTLGRGLPRNELATKPRAANVIQPRVGLIETLIRTMKRRRTAKLLKQLDSRLLDDIGITRGDIDEIAAKSAAAAVVRQGSPVMPRIASLTKLPASILTFVTKAWRRQAAIAELQRLSNHTLADIGVERGRIPELVGAMMAGDKAKPAPDWIGLASKPVQPKPAAALTAKDIAAPAREAA